jgi:hypothetical protein
MRVETLGVLELCQSLERIFWGEITSNSSYCKQVIKIGKASFHPPFERYPLLGEHPKKKLCTQVGVWLVIKIGKGSFHPTFETYPLLAEYPPKRGASPSGGMIVQCDFPGSHGRSLIYSTSKNQMRVFGGRRKLSLSIFKGTPCHSWVSTWTHLSPWFGSLPSWLLGWISCLEGESLWNSKANLVFRGTPYGGKHTITPYGVNTPSPNKYLRPNVSILQRGTG